MHYQVKSPIEETLDRKQKKIMNNQPQLRNYKNPNPLKKSFYIIVLLLLVHCSKEAEKTEEPKITNEYLVSSNLLKKFDKTVTGSLSGLISQSDQGQEIYDIEVHKIVYKTKTVAGKETEASGVVMFPKLEKPLSLLSYQHGTITEESEAPSNITNFGFNEYGAMTIFSATGLIVSMPDYLGYGASSDLPHPYEHGKSLAAASFDMLKAVEEFLEVQKIKKDDKLYLMGYSEGGYTTLALQKLMEASGENRITATQAGAGAYNKTAFSKAIIGMNKPLEFIAHYLWVLHTYNRIYTTLKRPWSDYVNAPYAQHLEALETINSSTINQLIDEGKLETNPKKLFKESLISAINNGSDTALLNAFADNDLLDWTPKAPVFLYHGTEDDFVFPLNSSSTAQALNAKGGKVNYVPLEGKDHKSAVMVYFSNCMAKINE